MEGLRRLYSGDFNHMSQERQPDGSVIITLSKRGEGRFYRFRVRDLYGPDEEILEEEVIDAAPPQYILDRMKEAQKHGRTDNVGPADTQEAPVP